MTKKQKVVFAVVAAVLAVVAAVIVLGTVLSYVCYHFIYGTRITSREGEAYHKLEGTGVYSPLAVFPSADMDTVSQDFYYQTRDEIFAATCQIYLENQYTREQYEAETERLRNLEFSYQDQTNMLYQDEKNYCSVAYVAMANWTDRYEYAITLDDSNTIIYVYLQNMDAKDIHMQSDYLPKYFQDNNAGKHQDTDPMTSDYRSFYAFRIGDHYIDCMDLADQIEIADTEPETQAEAVAQEVETPESQTIVSDTSEEKDTSSMLINSETEISADLDGDGKDDKVRIENYGDIDDLAKDGTRLIANVNGADVAIKDYETYVYGSTITTGDLSGDGKADVLWDRYIFGSNYGAVTISILHLEDTGWVEYPNNFIYNPNIDLEQPDGFGGQEMYIGATLFEKDGKTMVRFISLLEDNINGDTMKCTEVSYRKDGWYIEDVRLIDNYYRDGKGDELLAPQYDTLRITGEVAGNEDRKIVYEIAKEFSEAYFQGDSETIKKYLVEDYSGTLDTYTDSRESKGTETVSINEIKGLADVGDETGVTYTVQAEFLPAGEDSLFYLFMDFEKQEGGWRIRTYGLEK
jgi:hypothetical protein